jgi:hypothetical protein
MNRTNGLGMDLSAPLLMGRSGSGKGSCKGGFTRSCGHGASGITLGRERGEVGLMQRGLAGH